MSGGVAFSDGCTRYRCRISTRETFPSRATDMFTLIFIYVYMSVYIYMHIHIYAYECKHMYIHMLTLICIVLGAYALFLKAHPQCQLIARRGRRNALWLLHIPMINPTSAIKHQRVFRSSCFKRVSDVYISSDRGSGRRPLFQLKAALPACAYIRGAEWPIFIITFWVVTVTVARPNLVYA